MIDVKTANKIHDKLIERIGGGNGVRDNGALDAALHRPFATFDGVDLYPSPIEKAAALFESIIINHPFIDGNKRTAYVLMKFLLLKNGILMEANKEDKYKMAINASKGEIRFDEIVFWLQSKTQIRKNK